MIRSLLVGLLLTAIIRMPVDLSAAQNSSPSLRVATFESDVTIPLGERLYSKPLEAVDQPLQAKGIVLDDDGKRYVLCTVDWCTIRNATHLLFRTKLAEAVEIARDAGLNYVYVERALGPRARNTYCPNCGNEVVSREIQGFLESKLADGACHGCGELIPGRWGRVADATCLPAGEVVQ